MRQFIVLRKTEDNPCDEANDLGVKVIVFISNVSKILDS